MSASAQPISAARFAAALPELPLSTLHTTASQIRVSLAHLESSNAELAPHAKDGDDVCAEAIAENEIVMGRMRERLALLRAEVEGRGMPWVEEAVEGPRVNGESHGLQEDGGSEGRDGEGAEGGRGGVAGLSDAELARRMQERLEELGQAEDEGESNGVHL